VGWVEGTADGHCVGLTLGIEDGGGLGNCEGDVGSDDGLIVGIADGFAVGRTVGLVEGTELGFEEGRIVGRADGFDDGIVLGRDDGLIVGEDEWFEISIRTIRWVENEAKYALSLLSKSIPNG